MKKYFLSRLNIFASGLKRPWFKYTHYLWIAVGAYALIGAQFLPDSLAKKLPTLYDFIVLTSGMISLQSWLIVGLFLITLFSVEYAARQGQNYGSSIVKRTIPQLPTVLKQPAIVISSNSGTITFDYSTNNGMVMVGEEQCRFQVKFSKAGKTSIHIYNDGSNISHLARVKNKNPGDIIRFHELDSSSRVYQVRVGEHFMLENNSGYYMQGKILSIKDDSRGDEQDQVEFCYFINTDGSAEFIAL